MKDPCLGKIIWIWFNSIYDESKLTKLWDHAAGATSNIKDVRNSCLTPSCGKLR